MTTYTVTWEIDVDADSAEQAAAEAQTIMFDAGPENTATVFSVAEYGKPETAIFIDLQG